MNVFLAAVWLVAACGVARAGPPFVTDDPEPVEFRHWELYAATQYERDLAGVTATAPQVEINYGAEPDVMVHAILPLAVSRPSGDPTLYGIGDTELGLKYRFMHEIGALPQGGTFPLVELPTGSRDRGLGEGQVSVFLPLWFQKSAGPWTTYGGGGYWIHHRGGGDKDYWQTGWAVQRDLSRRVTLGAELFNLSSRAEGERGRTAVNAGAIVNVSEETHLLFSAGTNIQGPSAFFLYAACQWTLGPENPPAASPGQ